MGKKKIAVFLGIQILLLFYSIYLFIVPLKEYCFTGDRLVTSQGVYLEDFLEKNISGYYIDGSIWSEEDNILKETDEEAEIDLPTIATKPINLKRGSYEIEIKYLTDSSNNTYSVSDKYNTRSVIKGRQEVVLAEGREIERFPMYIAGSIEDYLLTVNYAGEGWIFLEEVLIRETDRWKWINLGIILFISAIFDIGLVWKHFNSDKFDFEKKKAVIGGVVLLSVFASVPLFSSGLYMGHDLDFHLFRIEAVRDALRGGQIPVRVPFSWLNGYGYAVSVFYGDILLYFPAVLRMIGFTVQDAYEIYVMGINIGSAVICYYCLYKILRYRIAAMIGCAAYVLAPYRLSCIYIRSAVGEYTAMMFFPLIIYGLYCIYEETNKERKKGWILSVVGFTGVIQSHVISTMIAGIFTVILCILLIRKTLKWNYLKELLKIVGGTIAVNLGFIIPFLDYMRFDYRATNLQNYGKTGSMAVDVEEVLALFSNSDSMGYEIGGVFLVAGLIWWLCKMIQEDKISDGVYKAGNYSLGLGLLALFMTTVWFPWNFIEQRNKITAMIVQNIQFPWRMLGIASILLSVVTGCLVYRLKEYESKKYALIGVLGVLIFVTGGHFIGSIQRYGTEVRILEDRELSSEAIGGGEYIPAGTGDGMWREGQQLLEGENIEVASSEKAGGIINVTCENTGNEPSYVDVPFLYYKGYEAKDILEKQNLEVTVGEENRVRINLPGNYEGTFEVRFQEPWYWRMSEVLSLVTISGILSILCKEWKKCRKDI